MAATAGFVTHIICRLTAKNRDQLRDHTLGNGVLATFTIFEAPRKQTGLVKNQACCDVTISYHYRSHEAECNSSTVIFYTNLQ